LVIILNVLISREVSMDISVQDLIKLKFKDGAVCPHCGSRVVNKFGFFNGKQRYRWESAT
jgi:DNA-directed RNA polymerase subunit RPC12/RpoP